MTKGPEDFFNEHGEQFGFASAERPKGENRSVLDLALSSAAFVDGFIPPDYLLDGVLQRGFVYSLTGQVGAGKTTLALRLMAHTALGYSFAGRDVARNRVLMLVGENADDVRMRWIGLASEMDFDAADMDVHFIPAIFNIPDQLAELHRLAENVGGFGLVVVDTTAAYFPGDQENDNTQMGAHARDIRALTGLRGRPCVVTNSHPTKNANSESLHPRGGGAFLAEMDGNLTCAKTDGGTQLHWLGKFRGPEFEPMMFELVTKTCSALLDSRGRPIPTVIARPLSENEQGRKSDAAFKELRALMAIMKKYPGTSVAAMAKEAGWISRGGEPHKSKVDRLLKQLHKDKLAQKVLNHWTLTRAGEKALETTNE